MRQNTIAALLAVIAVLLGLSFATSNERPAEAATQAQAQEPYVVQISVSGSANDPTNLYRLWSDGAVDVWLVHPDSPSNPYWYGWLDLHPVQRADLNADGCVNVVDFLDLLAGWNDDCPPPWPPRQ
jgi:hypothetical protein